MANAVGAFLFGEEDLMGRRIRRSFRAGNATGTFSGHPHPDATLEFFNIEIAGLLRRRESV